MQTPPQTQMEPRPIISAPRFFADERLGSRVPSSRPRVPRQVLMNQIERHVRLEVAAAETFLDLPTVETLHAESASSFLN